MSTVNGKCILQMNMSDVNLAHRIQAGVPAGALRTGGGSRGAVLPAL